MGPIVSVEWLSENLNMKDLIILDASQEKNVSIGESVLRGNQIPGAIHFDLKIFSDQESALPNTVPSSEQFQKQAQLLGINDDSKIVVYDDIGVYNSPRVYWLFKLMGHHDVAVLDGGLPAWANSNFKIESRVKRSLESGNFMAHFNADLVKYERDLLENIEDQNFQVFDARSAGRFDGTSPEPREGLSSGHIPGSVNLPFGSVLNNGYFKSAEELKEIFGAQSIEPRVFSCGSGLTACIIYVANELAGNEKGAVYDGSWTEWASNKNNPIDKRS